MVVIIAFHGSKTTAEAPSPVIHRQSDAVLRFDPSQANFERQRAYETVEEIKQLIRETFPEESERALRVAACESSFDPDAYNPTNGSHDGGVFQISKKYHGVELRERGLDRFNIADNVAFARILYDRNGWQPWSASRSCWDR